MRLRTDSVVMAACKRGPNAERVTAQIKQRIAGEPIADRLVSMFDPDARPIRKGKLGKPNKFGYVIQIFFSILCRRPLKHGMFFSEEDLAERSRCPSNRGKSNRRLPAAWFGRRAQPVVDRLAGTG
jgi:hypothetical protein